MTTLTIGHLAGWRRLRGVALVVAVALLVWCVGVVALAGTQPGGGGQLHPSVVLTPEPRPAGY